MDLAQHISSSFEHLIATWAQAHFLNPLASFFFFFNEKMEESHILQNGHLGIFDEDKS